ncbi:ABC transporter substrate-binding protein [Bradyrhizobium sp. OAE829]|uniref:ABC transporter substrate-binding protein n=1 Tax=Bradyrhizobium sp. OAE829 TaxID=2663807 RepID=UPI00178B4F6B
MIGRRCFITLIGAVIVVRPLPTRGQHASTPVIGFLNNLSPGAIARPVTAFHEGLKEAGYIEGRNLAIEYRWAESHSDLLTELAADLARRQVAVIVATGGGASALAAKAATTTIPIVFSSATDPLELGLVASLNQPGGNATGVHVMTNSLEAKRMGLLHELVPNAATFAVLVNRGTPGADSQLKEAETAAHAVARKLQVLKADSEPELENAFATLAKQDTEALLVAADPFFNAHRQQIVALAERYAIPAIYEFREFAAAGGLMSYGISLAEAYRRIGLYTGRILQGAKPADLPVMQPTRFELVINLKVAKVLGITVPPMLLARADEVIE